MEISRNELLPQRVKYAVLILLRAFESTDTQAGQDKVYDVQAEINIGHDGHNKLDAPYTAVSRTVFGPRVSSEAVGGPENGSRDVKQNRYDQENHC